MHACTGSRCNRHVLNPFAPPSDSWLVLPTCSLLPARPCCHRPAAFWFFAGFVFIMTMFVLFFVPETKGVPIEELNE